MPTYVIASSVPFPTHPDEHNFVEMLAASPDYPNYFITRSGRYFPNFGGRVYVPEEHVEEMLQDGCTLAQPAIADLPAPNFQLPLYQPVTDLSPAFTFAES